MDYPVPLITALKVHVDSGWKVEILPWVVGARGMVSVDLLTPALEFLEIPKQKWTGCECVCLIPQVVLMLV